MGSAFARAQIPPTAPTGTNDNKNTNTKQKVKIWNRPVSAGRRNEAEPAISWNSSFLVRCTWVTRWGEVHLGERKVFLVSKVLGGIYVICTVIHWVQNYSGQPFRQFWQRRRRTLSCRLYLGGRITCGKTKCLSGAGPDDNLWQIIMFGWDDNRCQTVYGGKWQSMCWVIIWTWPLMPPEGQLQY